MEKWLECQISPGQFSGEYAVKGLMFDETAFSLFAPEDCLSFEVNPSDDRPVSGKIRVLVIDQKDDLCMVNLPRPTFENGRSITVKGEQLKTA